MNYLLFDKLYKGIKNDKENDIIQHRYLVGAKVKRQIILIFVSY